MLCDHIKSAVRARFVRIVLRGSAEKHGLVTSGAVANRKVFLKPDEQIMPSGKHLIRCKGIDLRRNALWQMDTRLIPCQLFHGASCSKSSSEISNPVEAAGGLAGAAADGAIEGLMPAISTASTMPK